MALPKHPEANFAAYETSSEIVHKRIKMEDNHNNLSAVAVENPTVNDNNFHSLISSSMHDSKDDALRSQEAGRASKAVAAAALPVSSAMASNNNNLLRNTAKPSSTTMISEGIITRARQVLPKKKLFSTAKVENNGSRTTTVPHHQHIDIIPETVAEQLDNSTDKDVIDHAGCQTTRAASTLNGGMLPVHSNIEAEHCCSEAKARALLSRGHPGSKLATIVPPSSLTAHGGSMCRITNAAAANVYAAAYHHHDEPTSYLFNHHHPPPTSAVVGCSRHLISTGNNGGLGGASNNNIGGLTTNNNGDTACVDMDLPSPPNEEIAAQQSGDHTPSGGAAGMEEAFGEAPHPTPGPIQDSEMECFDGDGGDAGSANNNMLADLKHGGGLLNGLVGHARDCAAASNRSRLGSPYAGMLHANCCPNDPNNPMNINGMLPAKPLSHDSQWMLQYLQPFNSSDNPSCCSSSCTDGYGGGGSGNEYYMPDNVRSQLTMIARMSDDDRNLLLDHLVWASPMRQLHHLKALLDPFFTRDFVGGLPRDVSLQILSYLEPTDLSRCSRVSRLWRVICEDNLLWQIKCQEASFTTDVFADMRVPLRSYHNTAAASAGATVAPPAIVPVIVGGLRPRPLSISSDHASSQGFLTASGEDGGGGGFYGGYPYRAGRVSKASSRNSTCGDAATIAAASVIYNSHNNNYAGGGGFMQNNNNYNTPLVSTWKQTYRYHTQTDRNWRTGQHIYPLELYNHGRNFITSMVIAGERVLTGSEDTTVRVVELKRVSDIAAGNAVPREVRCHSNGVWALAADDGLCVSGGTDRTISVVDLINGQQLTQLRGHTSTVRCLALKNDICVSGSRDNSLRVWAARTGECLFTLVGHGASVRCVCFDGRTIVSGSYDASVRVWNAEDGKQRHELLGHTGRIYCLEFDGERIVSGCLNSLIVVWSAATGERIFELHGHNSLISALKLCGPTLISGGADSVVRVWNLVDRERDLPLYVGNGKHSSAITAIHIGRSYFVTSSDDGYVKLWDLRTGLFVRNLMKFDEAADMGVVWRIVATDNKLICACGHRARQTDSKVLLLDFDAKEQIESDLLLKPSTTSATPPPLAPQHQQQQQMQLVQQQQLQQQQQINIAAANSVFGIMLANGNNNNNNGAVNGNNANNAMPFNINFMQQQQQQIRADFSSLMAGVNASSNNNNNNSANMVMPSNPIGISLSRTRSTGDAGSIHNKTSNNNVSSAQNNGGGVARHVLPRLLHRNNVPVVTSTAERNWNAAAATLHANNNVQLQQNAAGPSSTAAERLFSGSSSSSSGIVPAVNSGENFWDGTTTANTALAVAAANNDNSNVANNNNFGMPNSNSSRYAQLVGNNGIAALQSPSHTNVLPNNNINSSQQQQQQQQQLYQAYNKTEVDMHDAIDTDADVVGSSHQRLPPDYNQSASSAGPVNNNNMLVCENDELAPATSSLLVNGRFDTNKQASSSFGPTPQSLIPIASSTTTTTTASASFDAPTPATATTPFFMNRAETVFPRKPSSSLAPGAERSTQ